MVEGGMKCVKILIFSFNLLFVLVGIALIACGAYVQIALKKYLDLDLVEGSFNSAAALLIAVGVIVFLIAAFGCFGAIRENHTCVMIYAVLLSIIFILEIAGGIAGFVLKSKVEGSVRDLMQKSLNNEMNHHTSPNIWDDVQKEFQCCGVDSYKDWTNKTNATTPNSCCRVTGCDTHNSSLLYQDGCLPKFSTWVQDRIVIVGGIGIAFAFIQVVGILCACCLARAIKKEYEVV